VVIEVRGPTGAQSASLDLVRRGDDWFVLRGPGACGDVTCY
jgi:hypothetical protein